jgi:hypothetical protein
LEASSAIGIGSSKTSFLMGNQISVKVGFQSIPGIDFSGGQLKSVRKSDAKNQKTSHFGL